MLEFLSNTFLLAVPVLFFSSVFFGFFVLIPLNIFWYRNRRKLMWKTDLGRDAPIMEGPHERAYRAMNNSKVVVPYSLRHFLLPHPNSYRFEGIDSILLKAVFVCALGILACINLSALSCVGYIVTQLISRSDTSGLVAVFGFLCLIALADALVVREYYKWKAELNSIHPWP